MVSALCYGTCSGQSPPFQGESAQAYGIELATEMCKETLASDVGVTGLHFYTLNLEKTVFAILEK